MAQLICKISFQEDCRSFRDRRQKDKPLSGNDNRFSSTDQKAADGWISQLIEQCRIRVGANLYLD